MLAPSSSPSSPSSSTRPLPVTGGAVRFSGVVSGSSTLVRQVVKDLGALSQQTPQLSLAFSALDGIDGAAWCADAPGRGIPVAFRVDVAGPVALVSPVRAFLTSLGDV